MRPGPRWTIDTNALASAAGATLADRIGALVVGEIRRGRLAPEAPLPGSRVLCEALGVDRQTVQRALSSLVAEGWLVSAPRRGVFVARELPSRSLRDVVHRREVPRRAGFAFEELDGGAAETPLARPELDLSTGVPDVRLAPRVALARAYRSVLSSGARARLAYGDARGERSLRQALASMLADTRALATDEEGVLVTQGSQHGIDLVARALIRRGDRVAIEDPGYGPARRCLAAHGAEIVPVPVDARGLDVEVPARLVEESPLRAGSVPPPPQYPTMAVLAPERRAALLALAARHRFAILEDDYDHEWHFEGRPIAPLASLDRQGVVIYVGSLSKLLAPGLRLGFVVPPKDLLPTLAAHRFLGDRQGDHAREAAVATLIEDGEIERHVRRVRRIYLARRSAMIEGLFAIFGERIAVTVPPGGLALWPRFLGMGPEMGRYLRSLQRTLAARGVRLDIGRDYTCDRRELPHARVGFAFHDDRERELLLEHLRVADRSARRPRR